jgi:peptidoglycan/xylan/chitin deacetylase (PgdA/CDA1 family)
MHLAIRNVVLETISLIASELSRGRAVILLYHSISDVPSDFAIPTRVFKEQVRYLADHFELVTVSELLAHLARKPERSRPLAALTFDDGYADNFDQVLPILTAHGIRATFYPITGALNGQRLDRHGRMVRMLSWEQLREIAARGHEIGAHTVQHRKLHTLPVEEAQQEISRSKSELELQLNVPVMSFSYPSGRYTAAVKELVRAAGFTNAVTINEGTLGPLFDPFELPRIPIQPDTSLAAFKAKTTVAIDWYVRLRRWKG